MPELYAYGYDVASPLGGYETAALVQWLAERSREVAVAGRVWGARLVATTERTSILIVSDAPNPDEAMNLRLEAELQRLEATFSLTAPMAVNAPAGHGG